MLSKVLCAYAELAACACELALPAKPCIIFSTECISLLVD